MEWMIYGANGGIDRARGAKPRQDAAGRSAAKIAALARQLKLPSKAFRLEAASEIAAALRGPPRVELRGAFLEDRRSLDPGMVSPPRRIIWI